MRRLHILLLAVPVAAALTVAIAFWASSALPASTGLVLLPVLLILALAVRKWTRG